MAVIQSGATSDLLTVDALHKASRGSNWPLDHGSLGHYSYGGFTGILPAALGANSEIFQFRWDDPTRFAVIRRVRIAASVTTTFFVAGVPVQIDMIRSSAWTVSGTGGTAITMSSNCRKRTNGMGNSIMTAGAMRIATTAALGAGTKTLEGLSIATLLAGGPITASLNGTIFPPGTVLFEAEVADADHPLVLQDDEGFSIRSVAVPGTGTWQAAISVEWAEVTAY